MSLIDKLQNKIVKYKIKIIMLQLNLCGNNVQLNSGQYLIPEKMKFGNNVYIGPDAFINAIGGLEIHDGSIVGPFVKIQTSNHRYDHSELETIPYDNINLLSKVIICQNVWIGMDVKICPGVTIGEGAVVAMGSVVTKDVPPLAVIGGNPAKVIKYRDEQRYNRLKNIDAIYLKYKQQKKFKSIYTRSD